MLAWTGRGESKKLVPAVFKTLGPSDKHWGDKTEK